MKTSRRADPEIIKREKKREKLYRARVTKKILPVCIVLAVLLCLLAVRIVYIVAASKDDYEIKILDLQSTEDKTFPFRRGTITDRNNTVLAMSERLYNLIIEPKNIIGNKAKDYSEEKITATVGALSTVFGLDETELRKTITEKENSYYVPYMKEIKEDKVEEFKTYIEELNEKIAKERRSAKKDVFKIDGVYFETDYKRVYPFNDFACTLLGFSGKDDTRGNWGIEEYYNSELIGMDGKQYDVVNSDGVTEKSVIPPDDGKTVVSTVDFSVQKAAQNAIDAFLVNHKADNVAAIVMNPKNAEILALATDKKFDLNNPSDLSLTYSEEEIAALTTDDEIAAARSVMWKNFAVADAYEPGSTAKPFTVAGALELNLVNEKSEFNCTGSKSYGSGSTGVTIHCNAHEGHGTINLAEGLMYSCNVAMMEIAEKIGGENFVDLQTVFGFGRQSGIDLPGETAGLVYDAEKIGTVDLATNSFGQNFNVNMIQLASAFCSLINGGYYYQPHVVKQILSSDGQVIKNIDATLVRKTVSRETSEFIKNALFETVEAGTAKTAHIDGYSVGGKTGTAEKQPRADKKYLVSFVAAAPIEDPEILIYVIVDNPTVGEDEDVSAKLAIAIEKNIMEAIIPYTNIKASDYSIINVEALGKIFGSDTVYSDEVAKSNIEGESETSANDGEDPVNNDDAGADDDDHADDDGGNDNNNNDDG
ncbi:MAG: penicillin-binding protein 2 [Lachnospiraceae bacterium]|nr:penicillin-binding protein 2 [Lachnospiraceae bacterium]